MVSVMLIAAMNSGIPPIKCSLAEFRHSSPTWPDMVARTERIVDSATAIVLVRALGYRESRPGLADSSVVEFTVIERLRGTDSLQQLAVSGRVVGNDDYNPGSVPFTNVRPAGNRGSCFADEYRAGAQYLLLLRDGTPYWRALAPVNEQVRGLTDPWVRWVRRRIASVR